MQAVVFLLNAVATYLLTAWLLSVMETRRGEPLPNRTIIFFIVFLPLILISFELLKYFLTGSA